MEATRNPDRRRPHIAAQPNDDVAWRGLLRALVPSRRNQSWPERSTPPVLPLTSTCSSKAGGVKIYSLHSARVHGVGEALQFQTGFLKLA